MISMLCPSRGRPDGMAAFLASWVATTSPADANLTIILDGDDPARIGYPPAAAGIRYLVLQDSPHSIGPILNGALISIDENDDIGFCGDDHRFRTPDWARLADQELRAGATVVYGDDGHQGPQIPTAAIFTGDLIRTLGYLAPPGVGHMYLDNFWRRLGEDTGGLVYLPDVIIEHMHPHAGKADWDEGYARVNTTVQYDADRAALEAFYAGQWPADLARLLAARKPQP